MFKKISARTKLFIQSFPNLLLSAFFEPSKQPWIAIWDRFFVSTNKYCKKAEIYLRKYFHFQQIENGNSYLIDLGFEKLAVSKDFAGNYGNLHSLLFVYFDILYPYSVKYPIAAILGHEGIYEEKGVRIMPGDVVFDLGANVGIFTFFAASRVGPKGKVYAFEPIIEMQNMIEKSKAYNLNGNVVEVAPFAVGDKIEEVDFSFDTASESGVGAGSLLANRAKIVTLDSFIKAHKLQRVDFLKADIEGYEAQMLRGAVGTLAKFKPKLAICTYHKPGDKEELTEIIKKANPSYKFYYTKMKLFAW